jgi:hypothetical protein
MPYRDGIGPLGYGPMTGWGLGPCGRALGRRRSRLGFGWRWLRYSTRKGELEVLEEEAKLLKEELAEIEKEIKGLKGQK